MAVTYAAHLDVALFHFGDHLVNFFPGDLDGLFTQNMLSRAGGSNDHFAMQSAGRTDGNRVDIRVLQKLPVIRIDLLHLVLLRKRIGFFLNDITNSGNFGVGHLCNTFRVLFGDHTRTDDSKPYHKKFSFT